MLLHEGLTHIHWQKKPRLHFGEFCFNTKGNVKLVSYFAFYFVVFLYSCLFGRVAVVKQILTSVGLKDGKQKFIDNILYPTHYSLSVTEI